MFLLQILAFIAIGVVVAIDEQVFTLKRLNWITFREIKHSKKANKHSIVMSKNLKDNGPTFPNEMNSFKTL
uniref:Putative secreted protein n=1 Tax=Anopheles darlingi TaxID=43151 RepID=A0A2M4D492_ANODA